MSSTEKRPSAQRRTAPRKVATSNGTRPRATRTSKRAPSVETFFAPSHDEIARRAYEIFLRTGGQHGHALEHWLEAERELNRQA
jgi:hypothetical protein